MQLSGRTDGQNDVLEDAWRALLSLGSQRNIYDYRGTLSWRVK